MPAGKHDSLIKTPKQLVTVVLLAFVVPIIVIVLLVKFVVAASSSGSGSASMSAQAVAERLAPVGRVELAAAGSNALQSGEVVYSAACGACHAAGIAGAPKTGDAGAWAPRFKQGFDAMVKNAIGGFKGMPAKGGNSDLDAIEVARAVAFMANKSGGAFKEPSAPAAKK